MPLLKYAKSIATLLLSASLLGAAEPALKLKDNDVWVMAGDSITAQRAHTNYIEAFFRTRYPGLHLHFRNSGVGGDRTSNVLARFDYDVAAWKPTIVSVELGMNDVNGINPERKDGADAYIAGMGKIAENIRAIQAQPIFISSSPVNDGSIMDAWASPRCQTLHPFTEALTELGRKENILTVDQYHPLLNLWGTNKTVEDANNFAERIPHLKPDCNIPDLNVLQAFAKSWGKKPTGVLLGGDSVHTGAVGQYLMAAAILKGLNVDREVSSATLKPDGTVVAATKCKITGITSTNGKLTFTRLDECGPWPLLPQAIEASTLMPEMADLSRYLLTIPGLPTGQYSVAMGGKPVATLSNKELEKGWNMSEVITGPLGERSTKIMGLMNILQNSLNNTWRVASKEKDPAKLAAAQKAIEDCEAQLQVACQPQPITFEIAPLGGSSSH